jgi:hypothetical protein
MAQDEIQCYIRYYGGKWQLGRYYHGKALTMFMLMNEDELQPIQKNKRTDSYKLQKHARIEVAYDVSTATAAQETFVAYFSKYFDDNVYNYVDEYNRFVEIMMSTPEQVAHINRIMDL